MRAIVVAGGVVDNVPDWLNSGSGKDLVIGADGGAVNALKLGLWPQVVVGDLDSLPDATREVLADRGCRILIHPRDKDETDLELALSYAAAQVPQEIVILGALGGRLDHAVANILLLVLPDLEGIPVRIVDGAQEAQLLRSGEAVTVQGKAGDLVSLIPLSGSVRGVSTTGLAWALSGETLELGFTRGVSNVMTAREARIKITSGLLLVLHRPPEKD
jgi:thiamine pyrophosphokinase